ncbi:hypothetical protein [Pseudomonas sp.]|uniref:hypothetical protein n=1 Tax=Pseudomonas sp. TaxID=306 RepID=UPI0029C0CCF1|nr:hypothetical protein [Pseudomonas sp.]
MIDIVAPHAFSEGPLQPSDPKENVLTPDPNDPSGAYSIAAGEVRSRGVDIKIAGNLTSEWRAMASYAYVDAQVHRLMLPGR